MKINFLPNANNRNNKSYFMMIGWMIVALIILIVLVIRDQLFDHQQRLLNQVNHIKKIHHQNRQMEKKLNNDRMLKNEWLSEIIAYRNNKICQHQLTDLIKQLSLLPIHPLSIEMVNQYALKISGKTTNADQLQQVEIGLQKYHPQWQSLSQSQNAIEFSIAIRSWDGCIKRNQTNER